MCQVLLLFLRWSTCLQQTRFNILGPERMKPPCIDPPTLTISSLQQIVQLLRNSVNKTPAKPTILLFMRYPTKLNIETLYKIAFFFFYHSTSSGAALPREIIVLVQSSKQTQVTHGTVLISMSLAPDLCSWPSEFGLEFSLGNLRIGEHFASKCCLFPSD